MGAGARVRASLYTDPLCPWAYSFEPVLRVLEERYGDQVVFRTVLIGLVETAVQSEARGATAEGRARSTQRFRRLGMPVDPHVRPRVLASGPACRLVVAARAQGAELADALLRLLRLAWFTSDLLLDEAEVLATVADRIAGLDVERLLADASSPAVAADYEAGRRDAREPDPLAVAIGRAARSDGPWRYTAPSLVLAEGERRVVVPGFQPFEAVEVALVNLVPDLARAPVPDINDLVARSPGGLTTAEVARVLADTTDVPDLDAAERALLGLVAAGRASRVSLGSDALWRPA
jgi:predicted DsbA family dithiol-disulfide isomerase